MIERTSRSLNPEIETPVIETPVIEAPAIETQCSLDTSVIENFESYTSDFAVENIKEPHGKEAPKENVMVRKQCLCYCHSGITQIVTCTNTIQFGIRQVQCVWNSNHEDC